MGLVSKCELMKSIVIVWSYILQTIPLYKVIIYLNPCQSQSIYGLNIFVSRRVIKTDFSLYEYVGLYICIAGGDFHCTMMNLLNSYL